MTYQEASNIFSRARNKERGARLDGRSTRLVKTERGFGIKYHNTVVVEILPDRYILNTGGYRTSTTKERINYYSPIRVYSHKRVWYVDNSGEYGKGTPFVDGLEVSAKGKVKAPKNAGKVLAQHARTLKKIENYCNAYASIVA